MSAALSRPIRMLVPLLLLGSFLAIDGSPASSQAEAVPVPNSVQQIYRPGAGEAVLSTPLTDDETDRYLVEPLVLQATDVGNTAAEPTIGVDAEGNAFYAASTLLVDTAVAWGVARTDTRRSRDGGKTWETVQLRVPVAEQGIIPGNADPFIWVDQTTGRLFNIDLYAACSWLNISDDQGDTWIPSPLACGNPVNDHHTITAGPPVDGLPTVQYPNILYYCFNRIVDTACGRSLDGGLTWTPTPGDPVPLSGGNGCSKLHGHIRTDSEGRLFVPLGRCEGQDPYVAISPDAGETWTRVRVSTINSSQPHTSIAVDAADNLYYTWFDTSLRLPYLAYSTDHGATWSEPIMVAPPGVTEANFPVVAAGAEGHVVLNFPSSTSPTRSGSTRPWNQTVTVSYNLLEEDPIFHSATANDPADPIHRGNCNGRCGGLWDFLDVTVAPTGGEAWAAASDDCTGSCVGGAAVSDKVGRGIAIRQIGGPCLIPPAEDEDTICDPVPEVRWLPEEA